ncbi:MAG: hypothetical protein ACI9GB_002352 [Halioglobus sp.]|jgi:hypothetical protein
MQVSTALLNGSVLIVDDDIEALEEMDYLLRAYCGLDAVETIRTFLPETRVIMGTRI